MKDYQNFQGHGRGESRISSGRGAEAGIDRERECVYRMERRFGMDRRRHPAEGYMWISEVGWICRREKSRRDRDPGPFGC